MKLSKDITEPLTLKFASLARQKNSKGESIISLGLGEPLFKTPNIIVKETVEAIHNGYTKYSNPRGLLELREGIVEKFKVDNNILTTHDNVVVTAGAKQAMMLVLMSLLEPGDEVVVFTPCYVSYIPQIMIAEPTAKIHKIDFTKDDFSIDWGQLTKIINHKTKAIIVNSPNNPTGKMLTNQNFIEIEKIINKFNCYLISDEIYEKLVFRDIPHFSPGSINSIKDRVITINGYSKAFAMTGWRIGFLTAPNKLVKKIVLLQQHINTNTSTFLQKGVINAYKIRDEGLLIFNKDLFDKVEYMIKVFSKNSKIRFNPPDGGMFTFLSINQTGLDSDSFATQLLSECNVAVTPGIGFGKNWDDHIRISMVVNTREFNKGINQINSYAERIIKNK